MLPVLLDLKFIKIYTYGVFLALGFLWASFILWKNIRLTQYKEDEVFDGFFLGLIGGLFFGRLVYVVLNFKEFGFSFLKFILVNGYPGISLYGALIGMVLMLFIFFSSKKIKFLAIVDYFMTSFFIGLAFGKLGSFFSGSEVGVKTTFFLKTKYFGFDGWRHLTSFYEAIFFVIGAIAAQKILMEMRKEKFFHGFLFYLSMWYFSAVYFIFDKFKVNNLYFSGQSFNKAVAVILLLTISIYFVYYFRSNILNFLKFYGQKAVKKIHLGTKGKIAKREGKKSSSD